MDVDLQSKLDNQTIEPANSDQSAPPGPLNPSNKLGQDPILTIDEAAADLSISRRTIYDWVHKGIIEPPQKLGLRRVGYRRSTIDRFKGSRPAAFHPRGLS